MGALSKILNTTYNLGKKKADEVEKIGRDNGDKITKIKPKDIMFMTETKCATKNETLH